MELTAHQVRAWRIDRHHLRERLPAGAATTAAVVGLQDTPPGAAGQALAARVAGASPEDLDSLVIVQSMRGAPFAVARDDIPVFTAALRPADEEAARTLITTAAKTLDGISALDALNRVTAAVADALADGPLERDELHQALRERLPRELLWWCKGCGSHHVHPSLWRATGVNGVLAIVGRQSRGAAIFGLPPEAPPMDDPGAELARRFLGAYAPSTPRLFALWAGIAGSHARALWERAGELAEVMVAGKRRWALAGDHESLADPPRARGVRLLPGIDVLAGAQDRELLVPDPALRKRVWRMLGTPAAVLHDGEIAGTWRAARKGSRLVVTVEPFGDALRDAADEVAAEAATLAPWRGAESAEVVVSA